MASGFVWEANTTLADGAPPLRNSTWRMTEEAGPPPLGIVNPADLHGVAVPPRRWAVQGRMPWHQTTALYGDGGLGKSLLAQQLMTAAATCNPWIGLDVEPCRALGIFCEDDQDELHRRQADINAAYGIGFKDLTEARWVSRVDSDNLLMTFDGDRGRLTPFWQQVADAAKDFGAQLVVLDTAADMYGGNENVRPQVRQFVQQACTRLARLIDGAVLLCAHPSAAGIASGRGDGGNTAWNNTVRARWYLTKPEPSSDGTPVDDLRVLTFKKSNYGPAGDAVNLQWRDGLFWPLVPNGGDAVDRMDRAARLRGAKDAFLRALAKLNAQGRNTSHDHRATNYAPKVMSGMPELAGYSGADLKAAMGALFDDGVIQANAVVGKKGNRLPLLGIALVEKEPDNDN